MKLIINESTGHGKNVKGGKVTSTIRVIQPVHGGYLIKKQFRFKVDDPDSKENAVLKALFWAYKQGPESVSLDSELGITQEYLNLKLEADSVKFEH